MTDYTTSSALARVTWPEPIEQIWQEFPSYAQSLPGWKRPDIGLSERLFIAAVLNLPKERRHWGIVTWLSDLMNVSRPTLYAIGEWARTRLLPREVPPLITVGCDPADEISNPDKLISVTRNRIKRTALSLLFPEAYRIVQPKSVCRLLLTRVALPGFYPRWPTKQAIVLVRSCRRLITRSWEQLCKPVTNCSLAETLSC